MIANYTFSLLNNAVHTSPHATLFLERREKGKLQCWNADKEF